MLCRVCQCGGRSNSQSFKSFLKGINNQIVSQTDAILGEYYPDLKKECEIDVDLFCDTRISVMDRSICYHYNILFYIVLEMEFLISSQCFNDGNKRGAIVFLIIVSKLYLKRSSISNNTNLLRIFFLVMENDGDLSTNQMHRIVRTVLKIPIKDSPITNNVSMKLHDSVSFLNTRSLITIKKNAEEKFEVPLKDDDKLLYRQNKHSHGLAYLFFRLRCDF